MLATLTACRHLVRSMPKIFTAVADALEWCFRQQGGSEGGHYLDDYLY